MARVIQVIETIEHRGTGEPDNPHRHVVQYYSLDGTLLAESDPFSITEEGISFTKRTYSLAFEVREPEQPESPEQTPKTQEDFEGAAKPDLEPQPPEPQLWAVIALTDGSYGLWHPLEQSVLREPRGGLPKAIAEARRDTLNEELLRTVYSNSTGARARARGVLAHSNTPPSKPQPTQPQGLVHHYAEEAEAQRLANESQERLRRERGET